MDDEDLGSQRRKWNQTVRAETLKKLFPNAPKRSRCRMCKATYPNRILEGSSIAHSMCPECIGSRIVKRIKKKQVSSNPVKEKIVAETTTIREENLMTLKQYLEMDI